MYAASHFAEFIRDAMNGGESNFRVFDDTSSANLTWARFELWFDQQHGLSAWGDSDHGGHDFAQRNETQVGDEQIDLFRQTVQMASIGSFHHDDSRVRSELPSQLSVAHINGIHSTGFTLQQAVCESTGRCAQVYAATLLDLNRERIEGSFQFESASADIGANRISQTDGSVGRNTRSRFVYDLFPDQDFSGSNECGGLGSAWHDSSFNQQLIESFLFTQ